MPAVVSAPQYNPANNTVEVVGIDNVLRLESNVAGSPSMSTNVIVKLLLFAAAVGPVPLRASMQPLADVGHVRTVLPVMMIAPGWCCV